MVERIPEWLWDMDALNFLWFDPLEEVYEAGQGVLRIMQWLTDYVATKPVHFFLRSLLITVVVAGHNATVCAEAVSELVTGYVLNTDAPGIYSVRPFKWWSGRMKFLLGQARGVPRTTPPVAQFYLPVEDFHRKLQIHISEGKPWFGA
jgi:hypothetical protein